MKTLSVAGVGVLAVLITVVVEEGRISRLQDELDSLKASLAAPGAPVAPGATHDSGHAEEGPARTRAHEREPGDDEVVADAPDEPTIAKTMRKMWENPAGKAMMNQGIKMAVAMMYGDFIEGLGLTKEESEYFKELLGSGLGEQQQIGMKLMSARPEERQELTQEIQRLHKENQEAVKTFLNNDEDYEKFSAYQERLPERQQLDGVRAAMQGAGEPLDEATEGRLVEAMYRTRTQSKGPDLNGPGALEEMAKGGIVERYERHWSSQQEALRAETSAFLSPAQQQAFEEFQKNLKEMQMMSIKMAEQMMKQGGAK